MEMFVSSQRICLTAVGSDNPVDHIQTKWNSSFRLYRIYDEWPMTEKVFHRIRLTKIEFSIHHYSVKSKAENSLEHWTAVSFRLEHLGSAHQRSLVGTETCDLTVGKQVSNHCATNARSRLEKSERSFQLHQWEKQLKITICRMKLTSKRIRFYISWAWAIWTQSNAQSDWQWEVQSILISNMNANLKDYALETASSSPNQWQNVME